MHTVDTILDALLVDVCGVNVELPSGEEINGCTETNKFQVSFASSKGRIYGLLLVEDFRCLHSEVFEPIPLRPGLSVLLVARS